MQNRQKVIFKLYRNQIFEDKYRNLMVSCYPLILEDIKKYAGKLNKDVYFTYLTGELIDGTPILEIEYTGELSLEEKEFYIEKVKMLTSEGELFFDKRGAVIKEESTLCLVKFRRLDESEELVEVKKQKLDILKLIK